MRTTLTSEEINFLQYALITLSVELSDNILPGDDEKYDECWKLHEKLRVLNDEQRHAEIKAKNTIN